MRFYLTALVFGDAYLRVSPAGIVCSADEKGTVFLSDKIMKEMNMEKNGNTFAPGDIVVAGIGNNGKTASASRSGKIEEYCDNDQVKVAWDDGTSTLERPEHLQRG